MLQNGSCEIVSIDFQILHSGSPTWDLMYFIDCAADDMYRQKYYKQTLDHYYAELCTYLRKLEVDPNEVYSRDYFNYELKEVVKSNYFLN